MREPCCEANDYGFPCLCTQNNSNSRQAEDDGLCDYEYDRERERDFDDE